MCLASTRTNSCGRGPASQATVTRSRNWEHLVASRIWWYCSSRDDLLSLACTWLFDVADWVFVDVSELFRPSKYSLHGNDTTMFVPVGPGSVAVDPLLDVKGLELIHVRLGRIGRKPGVAFDTNGTFQEHGACSSSPETHR